MPREVPGWKCSQCHVLNEPAALQCFHCGRLRDGVILQAVLPEPAVEAVTRYEGSGIAPSGRVVPPVCCARCDRAIRPDWVACPHCGAPAGVPKPGGIRGKLTGILPLLMPMLLGAVALAGLLDLFVPQRPARPHAGAESPVRRGAAPAPSGAPANAPMPAEVRDWLVAQGIRPPEDSALSHVPPAKRLRGGPGAPPAARGVPGPRSSGSGAPAASGTAGPPEATTAIGAANPGNIPRTVDPAPKSALGSTGLTISGAAWVSDGGVSEIRGSIRNPTPQPYRFVRITYDLLDRNGGSVGVASDSVTHLNGGSTRDFAVLVTQKDAVRCRLKEVQTN